MSRGPAAAGDWLAAPGGRELLLGGQKSGKSRTAELRAARWLRQAGGGAGDAPREACLLATAVAGDEEMAARIARHRLERAARVPALRTVETGPALSALIDELAAPHRLLVVDCLTLWLTQVALPPGLPPAAPAGVEQRCGELVAAVRRARGPLVLVGNEIGLGLTPLGADARRVVDQLGLLHQALASVCEHVTLTVAGCELAIKRTGALAGGAA